MVSFHLALAAGSLFTLISGAPVPSSPSVTEVTSSTLLRARSSAYLTTFGGTGDISNGWPSLSDWVSTLDAMFESNMEIMKSSCAQWNVPNNSDDEIATLKSSIESVASSTGVDPRFILAILLQESNGCVRAPTTNYGVRNPGLLQSHNGVGTCNDGGVQTPCPSSEMIQMIQDGVAGTSSGDGLKQILAQVGVTDVSMYYKAARIYNSGSIDPSKNLGAGIATHCYSSDIANRLTGWSTGPSSCNPNTVASLAGSVVDNLSSGDTPADPVKVSVSSVRPIATTTSSKSLTSSTPVLDGGAFAEISGAIATNAPEKSTPSTPSPTPINTIAISTSVSSQPTESIQSSSTSVVTATVVPVPAPSASAKPVPSTPITPSPGVESPGSACTQEGLWNCIDGISFQQCGSGIWSVVNQLAAGTLCTAGQSTAINIYANETKRVVVLAS